MTTRRAATLAAVLVAAALTAQPATAQPATAQPAAVTPGIVGGEPASITDYPWVVVLVDQNGYPFCDGTLTSPTTVTTAAHCMLGRQPANVLVVGGRTDLDQITDGDSVAGVTDIAMSPTFIAAQAGDDIATVTLDNAFPYPTLPLATHDYPTGTVGTVLGWGSLGPGQDTTSLHAAHVPIVDDQTCATLFDHVVASGTYDSRAMFCAGGPHEGICAGDAGGPLVVDGTLAGIASWSIGCGQDPDFYTNVSTYAATSTTATPPTTAIRSAAPLARPRHGTDPCTARCAAPGRSASGAPSRR
jgi:secreted trypsin-like serine protease